MSLFVYCNGTDRVVNLARADVIRVNDAGELPLVEAFVAGEWYPVRDCTSRTEAAGLLNRLALRANGGVSPTDAPPTSARGPVSHFGAARSVRT